MVGVSDLAPQLPCKYKTASRSVNFFSTRDKYKSHEGVFLVTFSSPPQVLLRDSKMGRR